jgi:putative tryptophan/tyrosine transport system substrate-binding protein
MIQFEHGLRHTQGQLKPLAGSKELCFSAYKVQHSIGGQMERRKFIAILGGAVVWPTKAHLQQRERIPHVGVLVGLASSSDDPVAVESLRPFREEMRKAGWIEGNNISLDYRFGGGDLEKITSSADELVALGPDLIYAQGLPAARAVHQKTKTIPIVFAQVADPVGFGLVDSVMHPGGNVTGFVVWDLSIGGKWIQLLREIAPELRRVGIIYNPDTGPYGPPLIESAKAAVGSDVTFIEFPTRNDSDIEGAASLLSGEPHGGIFVIPEPFTVTHRDQIIRQSVRFRLPTILSVASAADRGALIAYTYNYDAMLRLPVAYIDRILKGESPSNLPVQGPTKFELSINLKTAKELGLSVPPALLAIADKVIE